MSEPKSKTPGFYRYFPLSERDRKWGLCITTTGETSIGPHQPYPPAGHPKAYDFEWSRGRVLHDYQIVYVSKGRGWFESRETPRQSIESGTVFLLFPQMWHRYRPEPETGWVEHWIGFEGDIPRRWAKHGFFSPKAPILRPVPEDALLGLYSRVIEAVRSQQPALQQVLAGLVSQMAGLLYSASQGRLTGQAQSVSAIQRAIDQMQSELAVNLDAPALAQQLGVSYSWFRRTFAEHTGLSPHQYLLELCLVRARTLLSQTTLSVKAVASEVGFEDEHYFCRLFRRKTGVTPTEWRTRLRAQTPSGRDAQTASASPA
ncbi:MAG TPA: AraC family transcriptional regulator [Bacillota bacterium]|nr:AraC family transcriptional regulator [Bacillota bacterium]